MQTRMRWIIEVMIKCLELWGCEQLIFDPELPADLWFKIYDDDKYNESNGAIVMNVCSLYCCGFDVDEKIYGMMERHWEASNKDKT